MALGLANRGICSAMTNGRIRHQLDACNYIAQIFHGLLLMARVGGVRS